MPDRSFPVLLDRELCIDVIRFSDGKIDLATLCENLLDSWIEQSIDGGGREWGERAMEVAEIYAPQIAERWREEDAEEWALREKNRQPLVWKEVTVPTGSEVRMSYDGSYHYAVVKAGTILDGDRSYSPSEWASKVAKHTSRNAWRDLWFKEPGTSQWVPATVLRDRARKALAIEPDAN